MVTGKRHPFAYDYTVGFDNTGLITGLQLTYDFPQATRVTLGANNLFDRNPPLTASTTGYAEATNYFLPRFLYVDITKKF